MMEKNVYSKLTLWFRVALLGSTKTYVLETGENEKCPLNWGGNLRLKNEAD